MKISNKFIKILKSKGGLTSYLTDFGQSPSGEV